MVVSGGGGGGGWAGANEGPKCLFYHGTIVTKDNLKNVRNVFFTNVFQIIHGNNCTQSKYTRIMNFLHLLLCDEFPNDNLLGLCCSSLHTKKLEVPAFLCFFF